MEEAVSLLDLIDLWLAEGLIDGTSFARLRNHYERVAEQRRAPSPAARAVASGQEPLGPREPPAAPAAAAPPASRPPSFSIGEWAARRQADVLLYVGAFLLVVSALIFVSSQGEQLTAGWRLVILGAYTAAFVGGGLLLRRWQRVREAGPVFLAIGALLTPLNFVALAQLLEPSEVPGSVVWFFAASYSSVFYGFLAGRGAGRLYVVPAAFALLNAWGAAAVALDLPGQWYAAWWMGFALAALGALVASGRASRLTMVPVILIASLSLALAHVIATFTEVSPHRWQLPATDALALVGVVWSGRLWRRDVALPLSAVLAPAAAIACLWAADLSPQWATVPPLAATATLLLTRDRWSGWGAPLAHLGWVLTAAGLLVPWLLVGDQLDGGSWVASAIFASTAALGMAAGWRNTADGIASVPWTERAETLPLERLLFGWLGAGAALVAVGFAQRAIGVGRIDSGWAFAALAAAASVTLVLWSRRRMARTLPLLPPVLLPAVLPVVLVATAVSIQPLRSAAGHNALLLILPSLHLLVASVLLRRWSLAAIAVAMAMAAAAALWEWQGWPWWRFAAAEAVAALALSLLLAPRRHYRQLLSAPTETQVGVQAISWLPFVAAIATACAALAARSDGGVSVVSLVEYRTLVLVALALVPALAWEARSQRRWEPALAAWALSLAGLAALWPIAGWSTWTLALAYSALGSAAWGALRGRRRAGWDWPQVAVQTISWSGLLLAPLAALAALDARLQLVSGSPVTLVEFRALALTFLPLAALVAGEARHRALGWIFLPASALAMVAVELGIATLEPGNVQAHTVPAAFYVASVGLLTRSAEPLTRQLGWHELLQVVAAAMLFLPQAQQGFAPGGAGWGLILVAEGILLLGAAIVLGARWLVVSAVVTLSGVALRFLFEGRDSVPYWSILGAAGLLLMAVGLVVLMQREWWERTRRALEQWWHQHGGVARGGERTLPALALLSALLPLGTILLLADLR